MVAPPGELHELIVRRAAENDGVALGEILRQAREGRDFRRTNEGKVFRIEEDDFPHAWEARLAERFEGCLAVFFDLVKSRLDASHNERRYAVPNSQHVFLLENAVGAYCGLLLETVASNSSSLEAQRGPAPPFGSP